MVVWGPFLTLAGFLLLRPPFSLSASLGRLRLGRVVASVLRPCFVASFPFGLCPFGFAMCRCEASASVPFGVSPFVLCSPVWLGPFACVLFVWRLSAPPLPVFASLPPRLVLCGALAQSVRWSLPLGIWLHLWRPGCPTCWECGSALLSSLHFASWQQRPLALCGVCCTLSTMLQVLLGCSVLPHWGIHHYDDPGPPLVSAKLHYCYSNAVGAAFSAPVLLCLPGFPPFLSLVWSGLCPLSGWFGFCSWVVVSLVWFFFCCAPRLFRFSSLPSLRHKTPGA